MSATNGSAVRKDLAAFDACLARMPDPLSDELVDPAKREQIEINRVRLERLLALEERLTKAGIDPVDLAELLWMRVLNRVEGDLERLALEHVKNAVRRYLEGVRLTSIIDSAELERKMELE